MEFFLGSHLPHWLGEMDVPLFISRNRLVKRRTFPKAQAPWALDSGGFTELAKYGYWRSSPEEYAEDVRRFRDAIERMSWCAPMDWMCEPWVIHGGLHAGQFFAGTRAARGLSADEPDDLDAAIRLHQRYTVDNLVTLRRIAPDLPFIPVLQGWQIQDYQRCAQMYEEAGIHLADEPLVGLGSVCRRQATHEIGAIVSHFAAQGLALHGFGVKITGVAAYGHLLASADSMAWSAGARRRPRLPECTHRAQTCANCPRYALRWRQKVITALAERQSGERGRRARTSPSEPTSCGTGSSIQRIQDRIEISLW
jgi:hypothetical protein